VECATNHHIGDGGSRPRFPWHWGRGREAGTQLEQGGHQIRAADAVHHAVVHLPEDRPATALQSLEEPNFPQPPRPVQPLRENQRCRLPQLLGAAWRRNAHVAQVVPELEMFIIGPVWADYLQRHRAYYLPGAGQQREFRREQVEDLRIRRNRALKDCQRADMHRNVLVLDEVEASVKRVHPLHGSSLRLGRQMTVTQSITSTRHGTGGLIAVARAPGDLTRAYSSAPAP